MKGILAPVVTPFRSDLAPDVGRWLAHCRWLRRRDCGLAIFGTNSEANSLSLAERIFLLEALADSGLDMARTMPGTGACAIPDAVELTRKAVEAHCGGVLMLPPFYYKGVSDDGLFRFFAEVIERVGNSALRVYLYHIPTVSQVAITPSLVERLLIAYPGVVAGMKDSSGDWSNTELFLSRFDEFAVFAGSEEFLLRTLRAGGAGCISATANINPVAIRRLYDNWRSSDAEQMQAEITAFRRAVAQFPMIPALKAVIARSTGDPDWSCVRPPLIALGKTRAHELEHALSARGFSWEGDAADS